MRPYIKWSIEIPTISSCKILNIHVCLFVWGHPLWMCPYSVGTKHFKTTNICDEENYKILIASETNLSHLLSFNIATLQWTICDLLVSKSDSSPKKSRKNNICVVMLVCSLVDGLRISYSITDHEVKVLFSGF